MAGAKYLIQSTTNFSSWLIAQTNVIATSPSTTNLLPNAANTSHKFFRVKVDASP